MVRKSRGKVVGVIVISGDVGRGATTLKKGLADYFGWYAVSVGDFFRKYASEHGFPLEQKEKFPNDFEIKIDSQMFTLVRERTNLILEGHYAGWNTRSLTGVFRILCVCDQRIAEERVFIRNGETALTVRQRQDGLRDKFRSLYGRDNYLNPKLFHLVIDTGIHSKEKMIALAVKAFERFEGD